MIVDASVAVGLALEEPLSAEAARLLDDHERAAPDVVRLVTANALSAAVRRGRLACAVDAGYQDANLRSVAP